MIKYDDWLLKFCVALSWRVLRYLRDVTGLANLSEEQRVLSETALKRWAEFMLGMVQHPGPFEQHLIPLDAINSHTFEDMPQNINRYMLRAVELDLVHSDNVVFTFAKIGPFALFGMIKPTAMKWEGTKVHVRNGVLGPRSYMLPLELFDYLEDRAKKYDGIQSRISERQLDKIDDDVICDIERFRTSGTFAAMTHDVRLFGDTSVLRQRRRTRTD